MTDDGDRGTPGHVAPARPASARRRWAYVGAAVLAVVAAVVLVGLPGGDGDDGDRAASGGPDGSTTTTAEPETTTTAAPTTLAPLTTAAPAVPQPIPGLTVDGAIAALQGGGWTCSQMAEPAPGYVLWSCGSTDGSGVAHVYAASAGDVVFVEANVLAGNDQAIQQVASLSFAGADPTGAAAWASGAYNGGNGSGQPFWDESTSYGGVDFRLTGIPGTQWTLEIGAVSPAI